MTVSHNIRGAKKAERMFKLAGKKSHRAAMLAMEDTVLFAHETATKRAVSKTIRPFPRTRSYMRSIAFKINKKGGFTGIIFSPIAYAKKLETWYSNLEKSAELAIKKFPFFMKREYSRQMRKKK